MLNLSQAVLIAVTWISFAACTKSDPPSAGPSETPDEEQEEDEDDAAGDDEVGTRRDDAGKNVDSGAPTTRDAQVGAAAMDSGEAKGQGEASVPCEVAQIVGENCILCHGQEPSFGASFSLLTIADFRAAAPSDPERKLHEVAHERVNAQDNTRRMPPSSSPALTSSERQALSSWLEAGAQGDAEGCEIKAPEGPAGDAGVSLGGSGQARVTPIEYDDPELECHKFTAYASGDRQTPYSVPTTPDLYVNFVMKPGWEGTKYIRAFKTIIDNQQAIHHWILFENGSDSGESVRPGGVGVHPDGKRLYGWSPGSEDLYFDPDVGMKVEGNVSYTLEAHYNNTAGRAAPDASGVELCVTGQTPEHEVTQAWVGTDLILGSSASGTCTPTLTEDVHIIAAHPHMHKKGRHMKVVVNRADGRQETVFDEAFDFDYQRIHLLDLVIKPGDSMTTTCTYSELAVFGTGTDDEMCYFFPVSWPAGALTSGLLGVLHGENTCIDL